MPAKVKIIRDIVNEQLSALKGPGSMATELHQGTSAMEESAASLLTILNAEMISLEAYVLECAKLYKHIGKTHL